MLNINISNHSSISSLFSFVYLLAFFIFHLLALPQPLITNTANEVDITDGQIHMVELGKSRTFLCSNNGTIGNASKVGGASNISPVVPQWRTNTSQCTITQYSKVSY